MRMHTFRQDFQEVSRKLYRVVRSFMAEGGERESNGADNQSTIDKINATTKWNNFRKNQLDAEIREFIESGPQLVNDDDIEARK